MLFRFPRLGLVGLLALAGCASPGVGPAPDAAHDGSGAGDAGADLGAVGDSSIGFDAGADGGFVSDSGGGSDASGDAGVNADPVLRVITPTVGSYTTLVQGELLVVEARLEDAAGQPVAGARIDFALLGDPKDTSLSGFFAYTDLDGYAQVYVGAGQVATTFTLRVSGPSGQPVYATVEVAPMPTVDFTIGLSGEAAAALTALGVFAFADRTCDSVDGVPPSQGASFASGQSSTTIALPAGVDYALVVEATDGISIVRDCLDGIDPTTITSALVDFGFVP